MSSHLDRELLKMSKSYTDCLSTNSRYYDIGCIRVRVSDHQGPLGRCDLVIYPVAKGYTVIPQIGVFYKVSFFTSVKSLMEYIRNFEYFAGIFIKSKTTPNILPSEKSVESIVDKSYYWAKLKDNWQSPSYPEMEELVHKVFEKTPKDLWDNLINIVRKHSGLTIPQKINFLKQRI